MILHLIQEDDDHARTESIPGKTEVHFTRTSEGWTGVSTWTGSDRKTTPLGPFPTLEEAVRASASWGGDELA